jgi:thymidine kinase
MFSGKSSELLRRLERVMRAKQPFILIKPATDTRSGGVVATHSMQEKPATIIPADQPWKILDLIGDARVCGIDEAQFFTSEIVDVVEDLANRGVRVIVAGLDQDYLGKPFHPMPALMAVSEKVDKLHAICSVCGEDAFRSQKIVPDVGQVDIGADDKYEARCRKHFSVT